MLSFVYIININKNTYIDKKHKNYKNKPLNFCKTFFFMHIHQTLIHFHMHIKIKQYTRERIYLY